MSLRNLSFTLLCLILIGSCKPKSSGHDEMVSILKKEHDKTRVVENPLYPQAGLHFVDSVLQTEPELDDAKYYQFMRGKLLLAMGQEDKAVEQLSELVKGDEKNLLNQDVWKELALAYLRLGERTNCVVNHASESCTVPMKGLGIHTAQVGSIKAAEIYAKLIDKNPEDLESRWLYNLAKMTLGEYPAKVPAKYLVPGIEGDTANSIIPFQDVAADLNLGVGNMAGGSIVEDFDNDGYLDLLTSGWGMDEELHYFRNNADGSFTDLSDKMGTKGITGGLNITSTDYNNDGLTDVFVLRGGWKRQYGKQPNSLLKNNGDGTFTDVTIDAGMLSYHPTQTATWNDFNNDGWVDLFIGNETYDEKMETHPCELFINNQDGTFSEIAQEANCALIKYVKGVSSGDYDHDGWKDIFISTLNGQRFLLRNNGKLKNDISFTDVTAYSKIDQDHGNSFPAWFWDYNNDGWLDIFACDYTYTKTLGVYEAAEKLKIADGNPEKMLLYRNNQDGTFTNVADSIGLTTNVFAMGSNFGDIDNDGFLDMYLGSGNPDYKSLIPNKMFKNIGGQKFTEVTASSRTGHLQKGHGVSFADMDNDGDQDIYIDMGGVYPGDAYQSAFYLNPGQNDNNWVCLSLEGDKANRKAIGSQVKVTFTENGKQRSVYRDVNTGGSFGVSPYRREIGIGQAKVIDEIEVRWHGSSEVQVFKDVKPNTFYKLSEGDELETVALKKIIWTLPEKLCFPSEKVIAKK